MNNKSRKAKARYLQNLVKDRIMKLFPSLTKDDIRCAMMSENGAIMSKASDPTYEHNWQYKAKKPTLYLVRDVAQLGHNQPQQLADKYYKPLFKSPDLGSNY